MASRRLALLGGALGVGWIETWVPSLGAEMLTNGGMEGNYTTVAAGIDIAPNWGSSGLIAGQDTAAKETTIILSGSASQHVAASAASRGIVSNVFLPVLGTWYQWRAGVRPVSGTIEFRGDVAIGTPRNSASTAGAWAALVGCGRCVLAQNSWLFCLSSGAAAEWYQDDASLKPITLASCLNGNYQTPTGDFDISFPVRCVKDTQIGFACNLDSRTTPQNAVFVYINRTKLFVDKLVGGTWSAVLAGTAITYADDAIIRIRKSGTTYQVFYNGAQVGTDQTISDAGVINNTIHAQFLTYEGNRFTRKPSVGPFS